MPCVARDGVLYIEQARAFQEHGFAGLHDARFQQHPLFPLATLAVHRLLQSSGQPDTPQLWQTAGQVISFSTGLALLLVLAGLARRLAEPLGLPPGPVGVWALVLGGWLPLLMWLGVDLMSESLFLLLFCAATWAMLPVSRTPLTAHRAVLIGLLCGLAFLTRPEGAIAVACGVVTIFVGHEPIGDAFRKSAMLAAGFLVLAAPYMVAIGGLTPKLQKEELRDFRSATDTIAPSERPASMTSAPPARAALIRENIPWYFAIPWTAYKTLHAGRAIVPLTALAGTLVLRLRWKSLPLLPLALAMLLQFSLCAWLLERHGYLDPRHTLLIAVLCVPIAAAFLGGVHQWAVTTDGFTPTRRIAYLALALGNLIPLAIYSTRVPNAADGPIRAAADFLRSQHPDSGRLLIGGASERRIAFYAGIRWQPWPENAPTAAERYEALSGYIRGFPADFVALRTGPGIEIAGNQALLDQLRRDPTVGPRLRDLFSAQDRDPKRPSTVWLLAYDRPH